MLCRPLLQVSVALPTKENMHIVQVISVEISPQGIKFNSITVPLSKLAEMVLTLTTEESTA